MVADPKHVMKYPKFHDIFWSEWAQMIPGTKKEKQDTPGVYWNMTAMIEVTQELSSAHPVNLEISGCLLYVMFIVTKLSKANSESQ